MISKHGHALLAADAQSALIHQLLPITTLLTPNTHEASALLGGREVKTVEDAERAARELASRGPKAVLVKGGHLTGADAIDVLFADGVLTRFSSPRLDSVHTHGTGCTYSAAITAYLSMGLELIEAVEVAKTWLARALASPPDVGGGIGPVNHLVR
jgi:hydroxymethylpyrimidine/phosphomethylpyrimidine kinase